MFDSNDTFVEQVVKSKSTVKDNMPKYILLALTILSLLVSLITMAFIALVALFGTLTYLFWANSVEYEYDYTNGSLTVAKITNNSKRKVLAIIESSELRMVAAFGTNESLKYDHVQLKTIDASAHDDQVKNYILVAHDEKKNADYKLIFNPNEKLLSAMKKYNKRDIYE